MERKSGREGKEKNEGSSGGVVSRSRLSPAKLKKEGGDEIALQGVVDNSHTEIATMVMLASYESSHAALCRWLWLVHVYC